MEEKHAIYFTHAHYSGFSAHIDYDVMSSVLKQLVYTGQEMSAVTSVMRGIHYTPQDITATKLRELTIDRDQDAQYSVGLTVELEIPLERWQNTENWGSLVAVLGELPTTDLKQYKVGVELRFTLYGEKELTIENYSKSRSIGTQVVALNDLTFTLFEIEE